MRSTVFNSQLKACFLKFCEDLSIAALTQKTNNKMYLFFPKWKTKQLLDIKVLMRNVSHMLIRQKTGFATLLRKNN